MEKKKFSTDQIKRAIRATILTARYAERAMVKATGEKRKRLNHLFYQLVFARRDMINLKIHRKKEEKE